MEIQEGSLAILASLREQCAVTHVVTPCPYQEKKAVCRGLTCLSSVTWKKPALQELRMLSFLTLATKNHVKELKKLFFSTMGPL